MIKLRWINAWKQLMEEGIQLYSSTIETLWLNSVEQLG